MLRSIRTVAADPASLTISLIYFAHSVVGASWLVRLPEIQGRLALSEAELGLTLLGIPLGSILTTFAMPWISGRWSAGRISLFGTVAAFAVVTTFPLAGSMAALSAAFVCLGLIGGAVNIAVNAETAAIEQARGVPIMVTCHGFYSLGGMIGAVVSGLIASAGVPMPVHVAAAACALASAVVVRRGTLLHGVAPVQSAKPAFALPKGPLLVLAVVAFCVQLGEGAMADWSAVYLRNTLGTTAAVAGLGYAFYSMAMAAGRFYGDQITGRFAPAVIVRTGSLITAAGLGAGLLIGHPVAALVGFLCVGIGFSTVVPILYRASTQMPGMAPDVGIASVASAAYVGLFVGPPLIGLTAEALGLRMALGSVALLALVIVAVAPKALRGDARPASEPIGVTVAMPNEVS